MSDVVQVKRLRTLPELRARLAELGIDDLLGIDTYVEPDGPLAEAFRVRDGSAGERVVGNRWTVLPMEGWDGTRDGRPTELVHRRWQRFGESGAKLVWGGEAVAVTPSGRANPHQLVIGPETVEDIAALRGTLVDAHEMTTGRTDDLLIGLQLTHSGRWCRPDGEPMPLVAHRHPILDGRVPADAVLLTDEQLDDLVETFAAAAALAAQAGFDFVDVKHCHGYLLHELLAAVDRPGRYGGDLDHRTAFLRRCVARIRTLAPELAIGVRLSAFDFVPFTAGPDGIGVPMRREAERYAFGAGADGCSPDLTDTHRFLDVCRELGIGMVCVTAGSPYYNPHIQRPAFFPPSDGYAPPEDPLVGAARMIGAATELARAHPDLAVVGSGYSYLQQWLPNAAQHTVRTAGAASVGIGRGMLSYPTMPADVLAGRPLRTAAICRTFSDCTTAPRNGLVSGCYPLDELYRSRPERIELARIKRAVRPKPRR